MDDEQLENEACRMGQIMLLYGEAYAVKRAALLSQEDNVKKVYGAVSLTIRSRAEKEGIRITEDRIEQMTRTSEEYQTAVKDLNVARLESLRASAWWTTAQQKSDLIRMLGYRQSSEIKKYE